MIRSPGAFRIEGTRRSSPSPQNSFQLSMKSNTPSPRFLRAFASAFMAVTLLTVGLLPSRLEAQGNSGNAPRNPPFSAIKVLGDSLSDTGRTFNAIGVPPSLYYFNGRFSNGPLWVDYLAPSLRLPYQPLDNLSWAGANTGRLN